MEHVVSLCLQLLRDKLEKLVLSVAHSVIPVAFVFYFFWVLGSIPYRWAHFLSEGFKIPIAVNKVLPNLMYFHISKNVSCGSWSDFHHPKKKHTCVEGVKLVVGLVYVWVRHKRVRATSVWNSHMRAPEENSIFNASYQNCTTPNDLKTNGGPPRHGPPCF